MFLPYALASDPHYHSWSAFAEVNPDGVNTRLQGIIDATREAKEKLVAMGGNTLILAGDLFHKRGSVEPSVLNPVMDLYRQFKEEGINVYAIPGNHDLEKNESHRLSNASTALESVGVIVAHGPTVIDYADNHWIVLFPWYSKTADLIAEMKRVHGEVLARRKSKKQKIHVDAIVHTPIDGVLAHLDGHGLKGSELEDTGFDRVFAGHYHNHKLVHESEKTKVYSVGALTHQNWGDIGSKAGFMIVGGQTTEEHFGTSQPKFVELTGEETDAEAAALCKGNYVRVRVEVSSDAELAEIREGVQKLEAKGVIVLSQRKTVVVRTGATPAKGSASIEASVKTYLDKKSASPAAHAMALDILSQARAA